jgi:tetratricopeptide (TPR) repeat protein
MDELSIFHAALEISDPPARSAYLDRACAGDATLRRRIEDLLEAHVQTAPFMTRPAAELLGVGPDAIGVKSGAVIAGRYTLLDRIGEGGMGEVWAAQQTEPVTRRVAVKLIKTGMDSTAVVGRFEAERQALALMDHPNIAKVFDGGLTDRGRPFFVMELVNGLALTRFCDETKLTPQARLELFVQVCQAVQHAHQKGIVHRDLKPSNVLVTQYDGRPVPKVIDFGVAKAAGGKLTDNPLATQFGAVLGTLEYMAPEQAGFSALDVDTRADIYSLGVILYEMLTGLKPFDATRLQKVALDEVLRIIREEEPPRPSTRLSTDDGLPSLAAVRQTEPRQLTALMRRELDWVVMKCLEKDRSRRYETASALGRDVQRFLADEVVEARPPSAAYRLRKFSRKYRAMLWTAVAIAALLVTGIVGTTWGWIRARDAQAAEAMRAEGEENAKREALAAVQAKSQALEKAQKLLTQLEKSNEIITSIFTDLDIEEVRDGKEPLEAALARRLLKAARQLDGDAVGDPQAVATLQHRLGESLLSLGYPKDAIPLFARALEARKALGIDHEATLSTMNGLAESYRAVGDLRQAEALNKETLELSEKKLGAGHPATLKSWSNLALTYHADGKPKLAIPLFKKVLDHMEVVPGDHHKDTLRVMNNLALAQQAAGRLDLAVPLHQKTLTLRTETLGGDHPDTISSMSNLGEAFTDMKDLKQALPLLRGAVDLAKVKLGMRHVNTLTTMNAFALAIQADGNLNEACKLFEEALKPTKDRLGPRHANTLRAVYNLALCYQAANDLDRAVPRLEEAWEMARATLREDHPRRLQIADDLALTYQAQGHPEKAWPLLKETMRLLKASLAPDDTAVLRHTHLLAQAYLASGSPDLALPHCRDAFAGMEKLNFRHPNAAEVVSSLADCLEQLRQFVEAEEKRQKCLPLLKDRGNMPGYAAELDALGLNRLSQKKWVDAEAALRESLALRERNVPNEWTTFNTSSMLGGALLGQKKYAEAEPLLLEGYRGMKDREAKFPATGRARLTEAGDRLVELYVALGKPEEAARWRVPRSEKGPLPREVRP